MAAGSWPPAYWGFASPYDMLPLSTYGWLEGDVFPDIINYCDEAKDRLAEQYKKSPLLQGLICALISEYQDLELVFQELKLNRAIDTSVGEQLDQLGDIVGLARRGLLDADYRLALRSAIFFNISGGEPETIIAYVKEATNASDVIYQEVHPANVRIFTDGETLPANFINSAKNVVPAGVGLEVISSVGSQEQFAFDPEGFPDPEGFGFGEDTLPTEGGTFAEKLV